jgi:hypothetical protein
VIELVEVEDSTLIRDFRADMRYIRDKVLFQIKHMLVTMITFIAIREKRFKLKRGKGDAS